MFHSANASTQNALATARRALRPALWSAVVLSSFANVAALALPLYSIQVYDRVLSSRNLTTLAMVTMIAVFILAVYAALDGLRSAILNRASIGFEQTLGEPAFDAVFRARMANPTTGAERSLRDIGTLRDFISGGGVAALLDLPWVPVFIALSFAIHPMLGVVALVGSLLIALTAIASEVFTRNPMLSATRHAAEAQRHHSTILRDAETVSALGMRATMRSLWTGRREAALACQAQAASQTGTLLALTKFVRMGVQIAIMGVAADLVIGGAMQAGVIFAASLMIGRALAPVEQLVGSWRRLVATREAMASLKALFAGNSAEPMPLELPRPTGHLTAEAIYVAAPGGKTPLLKGVSFAIEAGQTVVVAGPSGSGKSSLVRALTGVWPLLNGSARLDGAALTQWNPDLLGRHIGYVPQEVTLFAGTVAQNIARHGTVDSDAVIAAAKLAGVHETILRLPQGYETSVGAAGETLSGGMRQRVALARALFGDPAVVILDEPNSNLDSVGDQALAEAVARLKAAAKTVVIVSHKAGLVANADRILMMNDGMVQAFGRPEEVLQSMRRPRVVASNG
jgi:ATP-binding cassette, subfamily C, bacterial